MNIYAIIGADKQAGYCGLKKAEIFLRMGIDGFSMSPAFVLKIRNAVRSIDLSK